MQDISDLNELLRQARQGNSEALGKLLEPYRVYLCSVAERRLHGQLLARVGASDVVQQTFLEAHKSFQQFLGQVEPEVRGWLESILEHTVNRAIRDHVGLQKRDVRREQPLDDSATTPQDRREELAAGHSTPSHRAIRAEDEDRLARALAELPEDQREAVRLRHLENRPLADIAARLGRTPAATAGLIKRGMQALRKNLSEPGPQDRPS